MSAETVINIGYAAVIGGLGVALIRISCRPRPTAAQRVAAARVRVGFTVWDFDAEEWVELSPGVEPGPGQMTARDIAKADELELLYLSRAYDPAWDAGRERLWDAVRDQQNQTKGETNS